MTEKFKVGQLRVWHIPQVPMKGFNVLVNSVEEAKKILRVLWDYDTFQYDNKIKPDYSNASGLEVFEDDDWCEYYGDTDEGDKDICELIREEA